MTGADGLVPVQGHSDPVAATPVVVLALVGDSLREWSASLISLVATGAEVILLSGTSEPELLREHDHLPLQVRDWTLDTALQEVLDGPHDAVLVVTAPVIVPVMVFETALAFAAADGRVCTVSFLSNDAGYLSFPVRNGPSGLLPNGHDETTITLALRSSPRIPGPVPVAVPAGSGVFLPKMALRALGGLSAAWSDPDLAVIDLALRGVARGLINVLDSRTFITTPTLSRPRIDVRHDPDARERLSRAHHFFPALYDFERENSDVPLADAIALRRAELVGIDVLIDGSCLGEHEMGTQTAVLSNIGALAANPRIRTVVVPIPGAVPPAYARSILAHPKVRLGLADGLRFPNVPKVDIIHRPFQPTGEMPFDRWREVGSRTVVTLQDLIAYNDGYYFASGQDWLHYRASMREAIANIDTILVISKDTAQAVEQAGIVPFPEAMRVVPNGTDHLRGRAAPQAVPPFFVQSGRAAMNFLLVLGASYVHKNRDLAIRAWHELRRQGFDIELVLAGVVVAVGSTRNEEVLAASRGDSPITLPDVTDAERNWLLRHAAVVLYPTSAEGFGLVPFEAAEFDTPTVFVSFGPLTEFLDNVPVRSTGWTPTELAAATAEILSDPAVGSAQVSAVRTAASALTWDRVADQLVDIYLDALSRPRGVRLTTTTEGSQ